MGLLMSQSNQQLIFDFNFEPAYTFKNFVKTASTEMAYNAALLIAQKNKKYNPFCIYGEKGVGKTHLMRAIGNEVKSTSKEESILYLDSKSILSDQERSINEFDMVSLMERLSHVGFLIIDDLDILVEEPHLDEKFFHLYNNHLVQRGKQLVFASSISPHLLNFSDKNLQSRLQSGLSVKIEKMNDEDKRKVIKKLSKDFEVFIPYDVINYILNSAPRDFKSIHAIVKQINQISLRTKKKITLPLAKKTLKMC